MTGEATDLVARLRERAAYDKKFYPPADPMWTQAATLIEAQAAEIEGFKAWVSDALAVLTTIAGAETPPQQHGHYLAHRTAVKAARTFLASRTERADG